MFHLQSTLLDLLDDPLISNVDTTGTGHIEEIHDYDVGVQAVGKEDLRRRLGYATVFQNLRHPQG